MRLIVSSVTEQGRDTADEDYKQFPIGQRKDLPPTTAPTPHTSSFDFAVACEQLNIRQGQTTASPVPVRRINRIISCDCDDVTSTNLPCTSHLKREIENDSTTSCVGFVLDNTLPPTHTHTQRKKQTATSTLAPASGGVSTAFPLSK